MHFNKQKNLQFDFCQIFNIYKWLLFIFFVMKSSSQFLSKQPWIISKSIRKYMRGPKRSSLLNSSAISQKNFCDWLFCGLSKWSCLIFFNWRFKTIFLKSNLQCHPNSGYSEINNRIPLVIK